MSPRRVLLASSMLAALVAVAACSDPTRPHLPDGGEEVVITTPIVQPPTTQPGPTTPENVPTLSVGLGEPVVNENGLYTAEVFVTVMNWPNPVVGEKVTFTIVKGSGTLSASEVLTGPDGDARTLITFGLADEQVIHARTATSALAETRILAYCAAAPEQRTLPCPPVP